MLFKKLFILDFEKKVSKTVSFTEGINIITSKDNQLGKSTIMKSMYYCLGGEVFFADRLNLKTKMHFLELEIKGESYVFIRHNKTIIVKEKLNVHKFNSSKELSHFLSEILELKIMLETKEKKYLIAPPVFTFLPYYIDQDYGWTPELKSFNNLNQFDKNKRKIHSYFHLSLLDEKFVEMQVRKKEIEIEVKSLSDDVKNAETLLEYINSTLTSYENEIDGDALKVKYETALIKYKKYSYDINQVRKHLLKLHEEIYKVDSAIEGLNKTSRDHERAMKNIKKTLEVECPHCQELFEIQSKDIYRINYNIMDLESSKIELTELKSKLFLKKQKIERDYHELNERITKIENQKVESETSFGEILKHKGLEETKQNLETDFVKKSSTLLSNKEKIKKINERLSLWNEDIKQANESYRKKLVYNLHLFNSEENTIPEKIEIDHTLSASGSGQVRVNLARVYSFLQLKDEKYSDHVRLPLLIDSPKGGEQSITNSELVISLITEKMDIPNQIIVATIDFQSFYDGEMSNLNLIYLSNPEFNLLNEKDYLENKNQINQYFDLYWQANK